MSTGGSKLPQGLTALRRKTSVSLSKKDPLQLIYERYERYLQTVFGETRKAQDTDREVLHRLKKRKEIPRAMIDRITFFVRQYHAARFGLRGDLNLEKTMREIEESSDAHNRISRSPNSTSA